MESFDGKELILRPGFASNTFLTKLRAFRKNEIFTDIKIHLIRDPDYDDLPEDYQETTIFAHKVLLSSISPYFEAMFSHGFSEANQNQVTIKGDFHSSAFCEMIDFFYSGQLRITSANAVNLLVVADLLLLDATRKCLLNFMQQTLNSDNCVLYRSCGLTYNCSDLVEVAESFINRNFEEVSKSLDFRTLTTADVINLISSKTNPLHVSSELSVLVAILDWSLSNADDIDQDSVCQIISNISWADVSQSDRERLRTDYATCDKADNPLAYALLNFSPSVEETPLIRRVIGCHQWILAVGFDSKTIEYLDLSNVSRGWNKLTEIPGKRFRYGMSGAGFATDGTGMIFVSGGVGGKGGGILSAVDETLTYHVKRNSWTKLEANMKQARKSHGCAYMGRSLYVVGGIDSTVCVKTGEKIDLEWGVTTVPISNDSAAEPTAKNTDVQNNNLAEDMLHCEWQPIPAPNYMHNSADTSLVNVSDNQLVAISTYGTLENDCIYDVDKNSWQPLVPGRIERDRPGVGHHNGCLIIAGGWLDGYPMANGNEHGVRALSNVVESLDLKTGSWTLLPPLNVHREAPAVVSADGRLWVIGGKTFHDKEHSGTVEVLNGSTWNIVDQRLNFNLDQECAGVVLMHP